PVEDKIARIKQQADKFGLYRIAIVDLEGNAITSDGYTFSVADRAFFQSAVKGKRFLSEPIIDKIDGKTPGIVYAVPVYYEGEVVSVLFSGYELDKLTERIDISFYHESGLAFITDSHANVLLHPVKERINKNIVQIATPLNEAAQVEEFKNNLENGKSGVSHLIMRTENRFFAYAPIKDANDWFLVASLPSTAVFERSREVILLTVLLIASIGVLLTLIAFYISITKKKADAKILKLAYCDPLTDMDNIERFKPKVEALFAQFGAQSYTLLNFDVKHFRYLNNDLGYTAGNELLIYIARCLQ
ncbi:MAG: cache domain-containing protein, partial [Christensenella sp.]